MNESEQVPPMKPTWPSATQPPAWRLTRVFGAEALVECGELTDTPGACAGCRRAFKEHSDEQLYACAALYAPTLEEEAEEGAAARAPTGERKHPLP